MKNKINIQFVKPRVMDEFDEYEIEELVRAFVDMYFCDKQPKWMVTNLGSLVVSLHWLRWIHNMAQDNMLKTLQLV